MTNRYVRTLRLLLADVDNPDESDINRSFVRTEDDDIAGTPGFAKSNRGNLAVLANGGTADVPFGAVVTAKAVSIIFNGDLTLVLNSGSQQIQLRKGTEDDGVFHLEADVTAIHLVNAGSKDVAVVYALIG